MKRKISCLLAALFLLCSLLPAAHASGLKPVKVGYFELKNCMEGAAEGQRKRGYAFDLLNEISAVNKWNPEYVYGDLGELLDALTAGEIDVIPCISYNAERAEKMLFTEESIVDEGYYIYAPLHDAIRYTGSPKELEGVTVATVEGAFENDLLSNWEHSTGVKTKPVLCSSFEEAWEAVKAGRASCTLNIDTCAPESGFVPLFHLGTYGSFFAVAQGREDIREDISSALARIRQVSPYLMMHLEEKYLPRALSAVRITEEERAWLEEHSVIRFGVIADNYPLSFTDGEGNVAGVFRDMTEMVLQAMGIEAQKEWTLFDSAQAARAALRSHEIDVFCEEYHDYDIAAQNGVVISECADDVTMGSLTLAGKSAARGKIAVAGTGLGEYYAQSVYPGRERIVCANVAECIEKVVSGEAGCAIAHTAVLHQVSNSYREDFSISAISMPCEVCYSAAKTDPEAISILNRGLRLIGQEERTALEMSYTLAEEAEAVSLKSFIRNNRTFFALLVTLVAAVLAVAVSQGLASDRLRQHLAEKAELEKSLVSYRNAIEAESLISLEINLTKNLLTYGVWKTDDGNNASLQDLLGMSVPCPYDAYIAAWRERFVSGESEETFGRMTGREHLLAEFAANRRELTFDYRADTISGRRTYLRRNIYMIRSADGDVIAYTMVKDISEIGRVKEQETALLEAISRGYDSVDMIYFEQDKKMDAIFAHHKMSPAFAALMTPAWISENNLTRRLDLMAERLDPKDREAFWKETRREKIIESFENDQLHTVDFHLVENGENIFFQERFIPIRDADRKLAGMLICIRSTDREIKKELGYRKDLEAAKQAADEANRAKSIFLFNMSHDIRTPMNAILGYTGIAMSKSQEPETVDYLQKINTAGTQLLSLVNQVLEMSRIESGRVTLQEQKIDHVRVAEVMRTVYQEHARSKGITLTVDVRNLVHRHAIGDNDKLTQISNNLVSNAIKYTREGGTVSVVDEELPCDIPGRALYRFTVEDNGIGMSEEYLPHLFEEFSREESSTISKIQGTGLGMPIVKRLTELMGGTIDVSSTLGKGTKFTVIIPMKIDETAGEESAAEEAAGVESLEGMKILLVEDNEMNREIAEEILSAMGAVLTAAEDGVIALEKLSASRPGDFDVVLMDVQMPRMDGYEATRRIRALPDKALASIPIIAMTANAFEEDRQNALAAGMDGHLAKPIDVDRLLITLHQLRK